MVQIRRHSDDAFKTGNDPKMNESIFFSLLEKKIVLARGKIVKSVHELIFFLLLLLSELFYFHLLYPMGEMCIMTGSILLKMNMYLFSIVLFSFPFISFNLSVFFCYEIPTKKKKLFSIYVYVKAILVRMGQKCIMTTIYSSVGRFK